MRTTLTLDDLIEQKIRELAAKERTSIKAVTNELLRIGLDVKRKRDEKRTAFTVKPKHCGFRPGIDTEKLNQIIDDLETENHDNS